MSKNKHIIKTGVAAAIFCILLSSLFLLSNPTAKVAAAASNDGLEFTINLEELFEKHSLESQMSGKTYIYANLVPFGNIGFDIYDGTQLSYEIYSPDALYGIASMDAQVKLFDTKGNMQYVYVSPSADPAGLDDGNGYPVRMADFTSEMKNGWFSRSLKIDFDVLGAAASVKIVSMTTTVLYVTINPEISELKALYQQGKKELKFYVRNIKAIHKNGSETSVYTEKFKLKDLEFKEDSYNVDMYSFGFSKINGVDYASVMYNLKPSVNNIRYITVQETVCPSPLQMDFSPALFLTDSDYDLSDYVSINRDGATLTVTGDGITGQTNLQRSVRGEIVLTFKAEYLQEKAESVRKIMVYDKDEPVLFDEYFVTVSRKGIAGERYTIPEIYALWHGSRTEIKCVPSVEFNGQTVTVENQSFLPAAKRAGEGTYTLTYTANYGTFTAEKEIEIYIENKDVPVFDFSAFSEQAICGTRYEIPHIGVNSISDGAISEYDLEIINPYGEKVSFDDYVFFDIAGDYIFRVTATDSDSNTRSGEYVVTIAPNSHSVATLRAYIKEGYRDEGVQKNIVMGMYQVWLGYNIEFNSRSTLHYSVYSSTPLAGVGSFTGQFIGDFQGVNWPNWDRFYSSSDITDKNGVSMTVSTDITSRLKNAQGNSVWYEREVPIKGELINGIAQTFAIPISVTARTGEYIEVSVANVYVETDGKIYNIFNGTTPINPIVWSKSNAIESAYLSATVNETPVVLDQFIPSSCNINRQVFISNTAVYSYTENRVLPVSVKVTAPDNTLVDMKTEGISGYSFVPNQSGDYIVEYTYSYKGDTYKYSKKLYSGDKIFPTIKFTSPAFDDNTLNTADSNGVTVIYVDKGTDINIPQIIAEDNVSTGTNLSVNVSYLRNGRNFVPEGNIFYGDGSAYYMIRVIATDEFGNQTIRSLQFTYKEAGNSGNPDKESGWRTWYIYLIVGSVVAVAGLAATVVCVVARRRKKNEEKNANV